MISKALNCFLLFMGYHLAYAQLAKSKALQMPFAGCYRH
jgi:hypothetical protein